MAIIQCQECKKDVSDQAKTCPHCGAPVESKVISSSFKFAAYVLTGLCTIFIIGYYGNKNSTDTNPNNIKPDSAISLDENAFGCEYINEFRKAYNFRSKQEYSAWLEIANKQPFCFNRLPLPQSWTVLEVDEGLIRVAKTTLKQYVQAKELYKHSYWTLAKWATEEVDPTQSAKTTK